MVVHGTSGSTSYETIPPVPTGGVLSTVDMVVQRCHGPRRLHDHDDDGGGDDVWGYGLGHWPCLHSIRYEMRF